MRYDGENVIFNLMNIGHMVQGKQRVISYKIHDKVAVPENNWFVVENTHEATFTQEEYDALSAVWRAPARRIVRIQSRNLQVFMMRLLLRQGDAPFMQSNMFIPNAERVKTNLRKPKPSNLYGRTGWNGGAWSATGTGHLIGGITVRSDSR